MAVMLERWNDDTMDALEGKVDELGEQMREQRGETRELRQEMKAGFEQVDNRFERVNDRFEQLHRTLVGGVIAMTSAFIAGFAALIVLIATLH